MKTIVGLVQLFVNTVISERARAELTAPYHLEMGLHLLVWIVSLFYFKTTVVFEFYYVLGFLFLIPFIFITTILKW